jgi:glucosamine-6-phosphate deaminase
MKVTIYPHTKDMAVAAARRAAEELSRCVSEKGRVCFMAATGASQFAFLDALAKHEDVDWSKTTMYHLDEYVGLPASHPASFRRYLTERLIDRVHPGTIHLIDGSAQDPAAECARLSRLLEQDGIDLAFVGIGENAHLGFNDPPADFETSALFEVVELAEPCREQQVHEGWFDALGEVPRRAITITIPGILKSSCILCVVPESRKAAAVKQSLTDPVTPACPASALQTHPCTYVFLDTESASLLDAETAAQWNSQPKETP